MLLDIIIARFFLQGGQWQGICCPAGQVSFGRSSENSSFSIPFSTAFGEKWGRALWGLQHSSQAMEKFDIRTVMELRA